MTTRQHGDPPVRAELRFAIVVTVAFALLIACALSRHEMWRDEMQAWMEARDSTSLGALFANTRYEGHTALWFLLLYAGSRVTRAPAMMQVIHGMLATATVFLVARYAPFRRRWRALIPFGYFFAYGYAVVSRPYALGVLLLFAFCAVRTARPGETTAAALLLALVANTSAYGVMLAGAGALALATDLMQGGRWRVRTTWIRAARAGGVLGIGMLAAGVWLVLPRSFHAPLFATQVVAIQAGPASAPHAAGIADKAEAAASGVFRSFVPVPDLGARTIWNSNVLIASGGPRRLLIAVLASVLLLLVGAAAVRRRRAALVLFAAYGAIHIAFSTWIWAGALYQQGYLFIAFLAALWLSAPAGSASPRAPGTMPEWRRDVQWIDAILSAQVMAALIVLGADALGPFSPGQDVARFLHGRGLDRGPVLAGSAPPASTVAGYLDRPIAYEDRGYVGTFVRWERPQLFKPVEAENRTVDAAVAVSRATGGGPVTVLLEKPVGGSHPNAVVTLLRAFLTSMMVDERCYVYSVSVRDTSAAAVQRAGGVARTRAKGGKR